MNEPIKDKAPKPPGLLPKNVQSWLIVGIALLMIVIMWLTGGNRSQAKGKATTSTAQTPAPAEVNETKIAELQTRIQELQKQQLAAQSASHSRLACWGTKRRRNLARLRTIRPPPPLKMRLRQSVEGASIFRSLRQMSR